MAPTLHVLAAVATLLSVLLVLRRHQPAEDAAPREFLEFISQYNKHYSPQQFTFRLQRFKESLTEVSTHNRNPNATYLKGINQFSDMDDQEFTYTVLMNIQQNTQSSHTPTDRRSKQLNTNASVDWRTKGAVTPVKNQGSCGSCWAFSATACLESTYQIRKGPLYEYSVQQLLDCCDAFTYGCFGCSGGWPDVAMEFLRDKGVDYLSSYPYTGVVGSCRQWTGAKILSQSPYYLLAQKDLDELRAQVNSQPVSVCVSSTNWRQYKSGVFDGCHNTSPLDHCVLLVGYEEEGNWIIKNSFGSSWGEKGYIRLAPGNTCGIGSYGLVPQLK